jgi:5-methylcytosine-specific restriction enzyme B
MKIRFVLRGKTYELSKEEVEYTMKGKEPWSIRTYSVEVNGLKYPPKQVISIVLKLGPVEFTTMDAVNVLKRIGFKIEIA